MDNQDIQNQLNEQQIALTKIYKSVEQTRKIIKWSGIISLAMFVVPAIILVFALPKILNVYSEGSVLSGSIKNIENINTTSLSDSLKNLKDLGF